mmetsp:Transcript_40540/g.65256  ORF Transcript_40540/g.65256 Transcript_40540/m.65256 type:complete len:129 (-) Transcript_40540:777-1163(-)
MQLIGPDLVRGDMVVSFYETKRRTSFLGIGAPKEEKVFWERWVIPIVVSRGSLQMVSSKEALVQTLMRVLYHANDIASIPKFKPTGGEYASSVFTYEISTMNNSAKGTPGLFNRFLSDGQPALLRFNL